MCERSCQRHDSGTISNPQVGLQQIRRKPGMRAPSILEDFETFITTYIVATRYHNCDTMPRMQWHRLRTEQMTAASKNESRLELVFKRSMTLKQHFVRSLPMLIPAFM